MGIFLAGPAVDSVRCINTYSMADLNCFQHYGAFVEVARMYAPTYCLLTTTCCLQEALSTGIYGNKRKLSVFLVRVNIFSEICVLPVWLSVSLTATQGTKLLNDLLIYVIDSCL